MAGEVTTLEYVCENCGRRFGLPLRRRRMRRRFCGRACADIYLQGRVERACIVCGGGFEAYLGGFRLTCSAGCADLWRSRPVEEIEGVKAARERFIHERRARRPAACELCGHSGMVWRVPVVAKEGPDDIALLCANCRILYERGRITPRELTERLRKLICDIRLKRINFHVDQRGRLGEIFTRRDLIWSQPAHIYMTTVDYGVVKAWHFHQLQTDNFFCPSGGIQLALFDARPESPSFGAVNEFAMGDQNPLLVQIPPGVFHGFKGLSSPSSVVLNMTDRVYNSEKPDEIRVSPHGGEGQREDLFRLEIPFQEIPYSWERRDG